LETNISLSLSHSHTFDFFRTLADHWVGMLQLGVVYATEALLAEYGKSIKGLRFVIQVDLTFGFDFQSSFYLKMHS
jgi:hypothetical protein